MPSTLIVSGEPRLVDALKENLGTGAEIEVVTNAVSAQTELFQRPFHLVIIDFEAIRGEALETLVTIDNVLLKERGHGILLIRKPSSDADDIVNQFDSFHAVIDLSRGRAAFDEAVRAAASEARAEARAASVDASISTDRLAREEIDLSAPGEGDLLDTSLTRLLYTLFQRKESGHLRLTYATHTLTFGISHGDVIEGGDFEPSRELFGAFAWSHGKYSFEPEPLEATTTPMLSLIAEGCRSHIRQRLITEQMSPIMRRYPVLTNLWSERGDHLREYATLTHVMERCDGSTNWEAILSTLGNEVADGFRAAYFAIQTDLVVTMSQPGLIGAAVNYSRAVRQARQRVDQAEVEKTKAYQAAASSQQRSKLERELAVLRARMREQTPHEIFGVWEGCGRKVVQDRFYVLVKEHHPDVYGGNTSGDVKSYAQDIFILIKDAYQKLLATEREQTKPPPGGQAEPEPTPEPQPTRAARPTPAPVSPSREPARKRIQTPRATESRRPERAAPAKPTPEPPEPQVNVKDRLASLSGFRKKQNARKRLRSYMGADDESSSADEEATEDASASPPPALESSTAPPPPEPPEVDDRQKKLDQLLKRAQKVGHPDAPTPSKEFFDKGYHAYREGRSSEAYAAFKRAFELDPQDPPIMAFYAYTLFLEHPDEREKAETLLRDTLQSGNRQVVPDACLFLGFILKAKGDDEESLRLFKRAHQLNPASRDAEREVRLGEKRVARAKSDPVGLLKNLFKK